MPESHLGSLISSLWSIVHPAVDFRFSLAVGYGEHLYEVPRRLGVNAALDAAAAAVVEAYAIFCSRRAVTARGLMLYSKALRELRLSLDDAVVARSAETLCAVMVLLSLMDLGDGTWTGHCEGVMQLIRSRGPCDPHDNFEAQLVIIARAPALLEGVFNDAIIISDDDRQVFDGTSGPMLHLISRTQQLLERWCALDDKVADDPSFLLDARECHHLSSDAIQEWRSTVQAIDAKLSAVDPDSIELIREHAQVHRYFGLTIGVVIVCNCVISAIDSARSEGLLRERKDLISEVLVLVDVVSGYGPMAATHVPMALAAAYIGAADLGMQSRIESALERHRKTGSPAPETARLIQNVAFATGKFRKRLESRGRRCGDLCEAR
ncbi:hypothetical protein LTR53_003422 [Teratosphaeriaceae sp. CCFEE 6253]|nr:hypothetical protein LTR53_003422 [Teratosphaeriaceae sp. CCFEE 6253]